MGFNSGFKGLSIKHKPYKTYFHKLGLFPWQLYLNVTIFLFVRTWRPFILLHDAAKTYAT